MDLHVSGPLASPAERAAVDAVLGPAESGGRGGPRDSGTDGHVARGGHAARARRDLLLPVLHSVQARVGWISQPAINYVARRLTVPPAEAYGVATFYALFATRPRPPVVAHVCDDLACRVSGGRELLAATAGKHPREVVYTLGEEVLAATGGDLRDDATVVCLDWHGGPVPG